MVSFKINKIQKESDNIADRIAVRRQKMGLSVEDAARLASISQRHILAIENGRFSQLPAGVYRKKIITEYAAFLGLNFFSDLEKLEETLPVKKSKEPLFAQKVVKSKVLIIPKIMKNAVLIGVIMICLYYLVDQFKNIATPPSLSIKSPGGDLITGKRSIEVAGTTEAETQVTINGDEVLSDTSGYFEKTINLRSGMNTIMITAKKKFGRERTIVKQILVKEATN